MSPGTLQRKCACGGTPGPSGECAECRKKRLQRKATRMGSSTVPPIVHEVLRSPGQPLDAATRSFMEPRLGHDFSRVRVHADSKAAESARVVNARAYTVGRDIVLGAGQYVPETKRGKRLMAHELAHVAQQNTSSGYPTHVVSSEHGSEREADLVAERVVEAGDAPAYPVRAVASGLQRLAGPDIPVTPAQIAEMRALFQEVGSLLRTGAITAAENAEITAAVTEAEAAIVTAGEVAAAGATATAVGEGALAGTAVVAADDVTGIGVADDVAIPFLLLAAGIGFGVGYLIGSSADEIAAAWQKAAEAVGEAVEVMKRTVRDARARSRPESRARTETQSRPQPQPRVTPDIDVEEEQPQGCRGMATAQRGSNSCHDQFATMISGVSREWGLETPEGLYADFDARTADRVLFEVKTGYRFLLNTSPSTYQLRERTIHSFIDQSQNQLAVATRCGYPLVWIFNDRRVAELVNGFIQPHVVSQEFTCDEDR